VNICRQNLIAFYDSIALEVLITARGPVLSLEQKELAKFQRNETSRPGVHLQCQAAASARAKELEMLDGGWMGILT
jgi:hypothetical protein